MPKPRPSTAMKDLLVERNIALWDAHHYNVLTGRPTMKDPVSVTLVTPEAVDRMFYGQGPTVDEAITNALARNPGLRFNEDGVAGALARLENALHHLNASLYMRPVTGGYWNLDDDIPF